MDEDLFWLTDEQMVRLQPYFPKSHGKPRVDDRRVLSSIVFVNRNGLRWCDAPKYYGPYKTLYSRWKRWGEKGIFLQMMEGFGSAHGNAVYQWLRRWPVSAVGNRTNGNRDVERRHADIRLSIHDPLRRRIPPDIRPRTSQRRIDPLTGLGNRRSFKAECTRLELVAARDDRIVLCGLIDVDDFKSVNDRYGHAAGVEVLRIVAEAFGSALRPYDVIARLGGDEFAFCLAVRGEAAAQRKAQRIHRVVSEL